VTLFLEAHKRAPKQIILDLDATDDPLHGHQEGRFFHGYYDCYCYLPLYVFCGRHLLAAKLRPADIDASAGSIAEVERIVRQIRARWPFTRIVLRADSGFAREALMAWCEQNRVEYLFGLARNTRLVERLDRRRLIGDLVIARRFALAQLQPVQRRLAGHRCAVLAPGFKLARQHRHQRVVPQFVVIVEIFVAKCDAKDPLSDQCPNRMLD
jgi:hypothetical protein